ncbi:hypothetical protein K440DRAFT_665261 [Wilcoxina mikolae CBS 423.85]|nr:hypothetical protein K440DRAFT_665261 [Wilcoxina mikolae CBS 423.85]
MTPSWVLATSRSNNFLWTTIVTKQNSYLVVLSTSRHFTALWRLFCREERGVRGVGIVFVFLFKVPRPLPKSIYNLDERFNEIGLGDTPLQISKRQDRDAQATSGPSGSRNTSDGSDSTCSDKSTGLSRPSLYADQNGTWRACDPYLPLCALESKRRVRRTLDTDGDDDKQLEAVRAQQAGEMLAIMMLRLRTLKKDPADLTAAQRTVFLIAAEQSKVYFSRALFPAAYLEELIVEGEEHEADEEVDVKILESVPTISRVARGRRRR